MRTTITFDDDVAALLEAERARSGASLREVVNRLLRKSARASTSRAPIDLPLLPGTPTRAIVDVSELLGEIEDERLAERDAP